MDTPRCFRQGDKTVFHRYLFRTADATIVKYEVDLLVSTPEQAFLECLLLAPQQYSYMDLFYMMEQLTTLRPEMLQQLLETTKNLKVKRMFLYMAEKAGHYWFEALDTSK